MPQRNLNEAYWRFRQGNQDAFEEIYEHLKRPVYTICWRILQSPEEAEDITHDVFLKVYTSRDSGEISNVRAWIFQIAHNMAVDLYRRKAKAEPDIFAPDGQSVTEPIDLRMDLDAAISKLTPEEKGILTLKINARMSYAEIAQVFGISLPSVWRKYRRIIRFLQQELNGGSL